MAKHYTNPAPKPRAVIGTPWWIRLAVYVVVAAVGLALVAFGIASPEQVGVVIEQPATPEPEDVPTLPVYTGPTTAGE